MPAHYPSSFSVKHLLLATTSALLLAACGGDKPKEGGPGAMAGMAAPVSVIEAQPTRVTTSIEVVGQTEGAKEVEVRARVGGILLQRSYEEGASVVAGQKLFQIDRAPLEIALAQARATQAEAQARVDQTIRETARLKGMLTQNAISQKEYDDMVSSSAIAKATLLAAQARVRDAELNLSYAQVTAPISGITGRAQKSEGTLVSTGADSLLTTIVQTDPIWVRFSIADNELDRLPKRQVNKASVRGVQIVTADGEAPLAGKLNFAASSIDPKLGTLQLRAELANPDNSLLPGQFVRVKLITGEREGVFLVPQTAVLSSDKGKFVFVVGPDSKAQPRPVQTGDWQGKDWVILGGLKAGDKIITDNLMKVRPDAPVKIQPAGARPDAGKPQAGKA
ncbi:MAG: efflux RND transporter periplasmic adaptor subunit [Rhodocyclaceae bacterium]|nr:MAG: efflux RND transporter periplasmic adaptor subunit [Rhodocyclaceae bacterium]